MNRMLTIFFGAVLFALITTGGAAAQATQGTATTVRNAGARRYTNDTNKEARIGLRDARSIARKACAGVIVSEELEHERGGSGLRYSFDIRKDGVTREVGVDAVTGKVLENSLEGLGAD